MQNVEEAVNPEVEVNDNEASEDTSSSIATLPTGTAYLDRVREFLKPRDLHGQVAEYHLKLMIGTDEDALQYQKYLTPIYPEQSIEGNLLLDEGKAADILRRVADHDNNAFLAGQKTMTIIKSIRVSLRRHHMSRKERRES